MVNLVFRKFKLLLALPLIVGGSHAFPAPKYTLREITHNTKTNELKYVWKIIKGKVVNEDGGPLKDALIWTNGFKSITRTDSLGKFEILTSGNCSLIIDFLGFERQEINPDFDNKMVITMKTSIYKLDPVETNKSVLKVVEISNSPNSVFRVTESKSTGNITIQEPQTERKITTVSTVEKNDASVILSKALIVKDGVISPKLRMDDIDPLSVQSIYLLKGESARKAYGEMGKNGVIVINIDEIEMIEFFDNMPEFPGGVLNLRKILKTNLKYPEKAIKKNIQGEVLVRFVVSKEGHVTNVQLIRSVHPLLDNEALRLVNSLPKWRPGTWRGNKVDVTYEIPINFNHPPETGSNEKLH